MANEDNQVATTEQPKGRDAMRAAIFNNSKAKTAPVKFFGVDLELRQPPMGRVMELQSEEDRSRAAAQMIVEYAFVPGTNERVFEDADVEQIAAMPFGGDLSRINRAIADLTDIDILGEEKNSSGTQDN